LIVVSRLVWLVGGRPFGEARKTGRPAEHPKWRLFRVTDPQGVAVWLWWYSVSLALWSVAKKAGWKAAGVDGKPVSPAAIDAMLANLSEADRAALLSKYAPTPKGKHK
jgi:hypothetical protein